MTKQNDDLKRENIKISKENMEELTKNKLQEQTIQGLEHNIRDLELKIETIKTEKDEKEKYLLQFEENLI